MSETSKPVSAFVVIAEFSVTAAHAAEFLAVCAADGHGSVTTEPGCQQFDVLTDPAAPETVILFEVYDDAAAFEAHKRTPHYATFAAAVQRLGLPEPKVRLLGRAHRGGA